MKQYAITITYKNGITVHHNGITWDEVLSKVSAMDMIDARVRLIGSDPL